MFLNSFVCKFIEKLWLILLIEYCIFICIVNVYVLLFIFEGLNEVFIDVYISDIKIG